MTVVVRVVLVKVPVQDNRGRFGSMGVILGLGPVVIEFVDSEADPDRRPESPNREAGNCSPSEVRTKHRATVEKSRLPVKDRPSEHLPDRFCSYAALVKRQYTKD